MDNSIRIDSSAVRFLSYVSGEEALSGAIWSIEKERIGVVVPEGGLLADA
jgi:hypothetical protein